MMNDQCAITPTFFNHNPTPRDSSVVPDEFPKQAWTAKWTSITSVYTEEITTTITIKSELQ